MTKTDIEITKELLTNLPDTYQKNVGEFAWDFFRSISYLFQQIFKIIEYIKSWSDLRNLELEDMARLVYQLRGITHREATKATGVLTLTGSDTVTTGDIFQTPDGLQFKATETKTITTSGTVNAECLTAGTVGNVPVGQITQFVTYKGDFTAVTNETVFSGGYEEETKDELWERYIDDVSNPVTSGNNAHYKKWALEVSGVGKVKVKPLWDGDNTVKVILTGNDGLPASSSLVNAVQDYIDPYTIDDNDNKVGWGCGNGQAPIGAYCTISAATAKNLTIAFTATYAGGYTPSEVDEEIEKNIKDYLKSVSFVQNYISYAKIGSVILATDGLLDYSGLTLNGGTSNISLVDSDTDAEVPVLTSLTIT